jgi:PBP1b-binding outer membrane lipoprotein LpoB
MRTVSILTIIGAILLSGCSGDPAPVVGNAPGVENQTKGEESPEVQARTREKQATQPGSTSQFGRD